MFLTTTDALEGYSVERYLGIVGGEAVESTFLTGHGNSNLHAAIQHAVNDMRAVAQQAGANAIIGVAIEHAATANSRLVVAYGTAVFAKPIREPAPVLPPLPQ